MLGKNEPKVEVQKLHVVVLCEWCKGFGRRRHDEVTYTGAYKTTYTECFCCSGTGRMLQTVTVEQRPFTLSN
jgi:hypothetical protein